MKLTNSFFYPSNTRDISSMAIQKKWGDSKALGHAFNRFSRARPERSCILRREICRIYISDDHFTEKVSRN
jgi:hypothetical protein